MLSNKSKFCVTEINFVHQINESKHRNSNKPSHYDFV